VVATSKRAATLGQVTANRKHCRRVTTEHGPRRVIAPRGDHPAVGWR
jgi:hypothetical protein